MTNFNDLSVLSTVLELRTHHPYLKYCINKLSKLRTKNRKTDKQEKDDALILLIEAERAWAQAQDLGSIDTARRRHHHQRRLVRSSQHATKLDNVLRNGKEPRNDGHVVSYLLFRKGELCRARNQWEQGLQLFSLSRKCLEHLLDLAILPKDILCITQWLSDNDTYIRECAHNLNLNTDVDSLAKETADSIISKGNPDLVPSGYVQVLEALQTALSQRASSSSSTQQDQDGAEAIVNFQNQPVQVKNDPDLANMLNEALPFVNIIDNAFTKDTPGMLPRSFLLNSFGQTKTTTKNKNKKTSSSAAAAVNDKGTLAKTKLQRNKLEAFDHALSVLSDAQSRAHDAVNANKTAIDRTYASRFRDAQKPLQFTHDYIAYQHLRVRIMRDYALAQDILNRSARTEAKAKAKKINDEKGKSLVPSSSASTARDERRKVRLSTTVVKLFDNILQNLDMIAQLELVEDDSDLTALVEVNIQFVKAHRVKVLASLYTMLKRYPEAAALSTQRQLYLRQARQTCQTFGSAINFDSKDDKSGASKSVLIPISISIIDTELDIAVKNFNTIASDWYNSKEDTKKPKFYDVASHFASDFSTEQILSRAGSTAEDFITTSPPTTTTDTSAAAKNESVESRKEENNTDNTQRRGLWRYLGL